MVFLDDRQGFCEGILIAVIEGDDDGLVVESVGVGEVVGRDGRVVVSGKPGHLSVKVLGRDGEVDTDRVTRVVVIADIVIHEYRRGEGGKRSFLWGC